jgi:hypothetical protein
MTGPTGELPEDLPRPAAGSRPPLALTGTPSPGVESGVLMLQGYQLIGGPRDLLHAGRPVRVTGRPDPDLMTTGQQGTPFLVHSAEPLT